MYFNRDLSWLGFNERVLNEAADETVPLMERVRFLAIFSGNLDEFFRVRFPAIIAITSLGSKIRKMTIPPTDKHLARYVKETIIKQLNNFGELITGSILPQLAAKGIKLYYNEPIQKAHALEVQELFLSRILSFIQPIMINEDLKENFVPENDRPYFLIRLKQQNSEVLKHAIVNIPVTNLPRFFELSKLDDTSYIVFIDDIIRENINCIFPGYEVLSASSFKITRDADLFLDEELGKNILIEIEKKLAKRDFGKVSRFLYERDMPQSLQFYLKALFNFKDEESYEGGRYHNLKDLANLPVKEESLNYPVVKPLQAFTNNTCGEIFDQLKENDLLLHFPYHSYNPVLSFFNQAAIDPDVRSIQITLYRVAAASHIVNALISAAKNGKDVTVFVELKARFDEANNIKWSKEMKRAGIKLVYSMPNIKVHSKIALIEKKHVSYAFIGTGNFNENTAQYYTDHALLTCDASIAKDLKNLFYFLQSQQTKADIKQLVPKRLLIAQVNMKEGFEELVKEQITLAKSGKPALIRLKLNSIEDADMIQLLYKASKAGVKVQLIIRGICCLVPGHEFESENITVKRIIDRYLEHSRIYIFGEGDAAKVFIGSADWMTRNIHYRIEVCVPIMNKRLSGELENYFSIQWSDNVKARNIDEQDKQALPASQSNEKKIRSQWEIYNYLNTA